MVTMVMDNQILSLCQWLEGIGDSRSIFLKSSIWIQIWNLSIHWFTKKIGVKIGSVAGNVLRVIIPHNGSKDGKNIKVLVEVHISQPFLRETLVKSNGESRWVTFKYKKCTVDSLGKAGRMAMFWRKEVKFLNCNQIAFTIEIQIEDEEINQTWWLVGIYVSVDDKVKK
ncbi:hypothetical protein ACH5RR_023210 [Cinchona calisaya]|uniref:DUF4283 domain-containing protein n=1 Tax=Cinchona calisaya TaxID=153742 RepID=A0ABD2ZB34_9GENT